MSSRNWPGACSFLHSSGDPQTSAGTTTAASPVVPRKPSDCRKAPQSKVQHQGQAQQHLQLLGSDRKRSSRRRSRTRLWILDLLFGLILEVFRYLLSSYRNTSEYTSTYLQSCWIDVTGALFVLLLAFW